MKNTNRAVFLLLLLWILIPQNAHALESANETLLAFLWKGNPTGAQGKPIHCFQNVLYAADGRYALPTPTGLWLRERDTPSGEVTLTLQGALADSIYLSFAGEHPEVSVTFLEDVPRAETIAERIAGGEDTVDLFFLMVDSGFGPLKEKGFAADLGDSALLASDIQSMYPFAQKALLDAEGRLVAYPTLFLLGHWQVNPGLWQLVFGQSALPETFDAFFDAMLLWEEEYASLYPEIVFLSNFDLPRILQSVLNAYAQQYERSGERLSYDDPVLYSALEKLSKVCAVRQQQGRPILAQPEEQYAWNPEIFLTAGYTYPFLSQGSGLTLSGELYEGVPVNQYIDIPPMRFRPEDTAFIQGRMMVCILNPLSKNKETALAYIEHAALPWNTPRAYYALHPDCNEPLEDPYYPSRMEGLAARQAELSAQWEAASPADRQALEELLLGIEQQMQQQDARWMISKESIEAYRALAPAIRLFEDAAFVVPEGSQLERGLQSLFLQYAAGERSLPDLLQQVQHKMDMHFQELIR